MSKFLIYCLLTGATSLVTPSIAWANSVKFSSPKIREELLLSGKRLLEPPTPMILDKEPLIDPFSGVVIAPTDQNETDPAPAQNDAEEDLAHVIVKLAKEIPATGTILFGDKRFLLAGKKKYKTGDIVQVKYKEINYDLRITNVTSTTFTIEFKNITHSRAVK